MPVKQPAIPRYLITAQELTRRLILSAGKQDLLPDELVLEASIGGWRIALTQENFHVSDTGCLTFRLPPPAVRIKHYNVCIFGQRMNVVLATDYETLRRELHATQQRVAELDEKLNPPHYPSMPYV